MIIFSTAANNDAKSLFGALNHCVYFTRIFMLYYGPFWMNSHLDSNYSSILPLYDIK